MLIIIYQKNINSACHKYFLGFVANSLANLHGPVMMFIYNNHYTITIIPRERELLFSNIGSVSNEK